MIMFGAILFCYELLWWCSIGALNRAIRKNFGEFTTLQAILLDLALKNCTNIMILYFDVGFLYNIRGKSLYMIFVAVLCIGIDNDLLGKDDWLRWFSGIAWMASGVGMILLTFFSPKVFENYKPSTAGFVSDNDTAAANVV
jgi:hypothetical protein